MAAAAARISIMHPERNEKKEAQKRKEKRISSFLLFCFTARLPSLHARRKCETQKRDEEGGGGAKKRRRWIVPTQLKVLRNSKIMPLFVTGETRKEQKNLSCCCVSRKKNHKRRKKVPRAFGRRRGMKDKKRRKIGVPSTFFSSFFARTEAPLAPKWEGRVRGGVYGCLSGPPRGRGTTTDGGGDFL